MDGSLCAGRDIGAGRLADREGDVSKRNPTAASLAKPQYRQRVKQRIDVVNGRKIAWSEVDQADAWCGAEWDEFMTQLEGWQETPRQMGG